MRRIDRDEGGRCSLIDIEMVTSSTEASSHQSTSPTPHQHHESAPSINQTPPKFKSVLSTQSPTDQYSRLRNAFRIPGVEGFRFAAHVWVLAFHCLPHPGWLDRLKRNGDSGVFFILTGMATEIALELSYIRRHEGGSETLVKMSDLTKADAASDDWWHCKMHRVKIHLENWIKFGIYWIRTRILKIMMLSFLAGFIAYMTFPIPGGEGKRMMPYALTFTIAFLERFDQDRIVWNPNPVMWFCSDIIFFWILHPFILRPLILLVSNSPRALLELGAALYLLLIATCKILEPYATLHSGWSFHPLPRLLQYICGIYVARFVVLGKTNTSPDGWLIGDSSSLWRLATYAHGRPSPSAPTSSHSSYTWGRQQVYKTIYWILNFMPDIFYGAQILLWSNGPTRYTEAWKRMWIWKTMCATPIQMLCLLGLAFQKDLHTVPETKVRGEESPTIRGDTCYGTLRYTPDYITPSLHKEDDDALHKSYTVMSDPTKSRKFSTAHVTARQALYKFWMSMMSYSPLYRLFTQQWSERVAPRMVNFLVFLLHFPLSWHFDRNRVTAGKCSIAYCVVLWLICITLDNLIAFCSTRKKS